MALTNLTTPGVYIQEISTLPASVVPVATAVPAFIGYTEKGPINTPTRITSLLEFQATFGGAFRETYSVTLTDGNPPAVAATSFGSDLSPYTLFYHLQMYYANGGGPCYIASVGHYDPLAALPIDVTLILAGIDSIEEADEVTLLLVPEALNMSGGTPDTDIKAVNDAMLAQCNKLKDRFTIMDVMERVPFVSVNDDGQQFRNLNVGANYLNYGSAYYPYIDTVLEHSYSDDDITISDTRSTPVYNTPPNNRLSSIQKGKGSWVTFDVAKVTGTGLNQAPNTNDTVIVTIGTSSATFYAGIDFPIAANGSNNEIATAIASAINNHPVISLLVRADVSLANIKVVMRTGTNSNTVPNVQVSSDFADWINPITSPVAITIGVNNSQDIALYNSIKTAISLVNGLTLPPAATMAGIYAAVDNDRGVWKAPANVGVSNIISPDIMVTEAQQGDLNVDATSGKSINVIRSFTGRGTLVWGARTLAGNDNEWRYVPVRRLFIFAEESIKKATEFVVFEPNDKNTWLRVKSMISSFLTDLWKQGALAGDKPEQAFFVRIGLGETMTPQDILEGKLIVTIGMAAVRPAEFIILQFEHKLQEA